MPSIIPLCCSIPQFNRFKTVSNVILVDGTTVISAVVFSLDTFLAEAFLPWLKLKNKAEFDTDLCNLVPGLYGKIRVTGSHMVL